MAFIPSSPNPRDIRVKIDASAFLKFLLGTTVQAKSFEIQNKLIKRNENITFTFLF